MAENIVITVQVDTSEVADLVTLLEKTGQVDKKVADAFRNANKVYEERNKALKESAKLSQEAGKQAELSAEKVSQSTKKTNNSLSDLAGTFKKLGAIVGVAFGVNEIIRFGKESVKAFQDAEVNARKLNTALSVNGGTQAQFDALIKQSTILEGISIFSDDDIQRAQTAALQYGLTADTVGQLIPVIADFASATGQDLQSALQAVISGTEGSEKALRQYGVQVDSNASKAENLRSIQEQLTKQYEGQAKLIGETSAGAVAKLSNSFDNLQEKIGEFLATKAGLTDFFNDLADLFTDAATLKLNFDTKSAAFARQVATREYEQLVKDLQLKGDTQTNAATVLIQKYNKEAQRLEKERLNTSDQTRKDELANLINFQLAAIRTIQNIGKGGGSAIIDYAKLTNEQLQAYADKNDQLAQDELDRRKANNKKIQDEEAKHGEKLKDIRAKIAEIIAKATVDGIRDETERQRAELIRQFDELSAFLNEAITIDPANADQAIKAIELLKTNLDQALNDLPKIEKLQIIDKTVVSIGDNIRSTPSTIIVTDEEVQRADQAKEKVKELKEALTFDIAATGLDALFNAFSGNIDQQIERIGELKDSQLSAIDEEEAALQESYDRRKIGKAELEKESKRLTAERVAAEITAEKKINDLKRKQDIANRAQKLFEIGIATARNIVEAATTPALIPFYIALGATQAAAVLATPLPKYKKGTLSVPGVGSDDSHMALLQPGEAVIPTETNRKYHPAIKAIYEGRIDPKELNQYVNLRLKGEISKGATMHPLTASISTSDMYALGRILKRNNGVVIQNVDQLAKVLAFNSNPRR